MDTNHQTYAQDLIDFIYQSPTQYHAVASCQSLLVEAGFSELKLEESWELKVGGKYYLSCNGSSLFAFVVGTEAPAQTGFRLIAAHTDSPNFKIKTKPDITTADGYVKLNTEVYGGPIWHTWLDRPLSFAGRVCLKSDNPFAPETKLINLDRHLLTIPNLAIHLNRQMNEGKIYNPQIDLQPVLGLLNDQLPGESAFYRLLAEELQTDVDRILEFDLHLYEAVKGTFAGLQQEFISTGRLDNLAMVHAGLTALIASEPAKQTNVMVCFDNEEIGSATKQGAASPVLSHTLSRIVDKLGGTPEDYQRALYRSFQISADMAHAVHPNLPEKHDPVIRPTLNEGPVIKIHGGQKYTSDAESVAVYEHICQEAGIPYQKFVNRADMRSGGTLGSISASHVNVRSVDIGNPMIAMHSVREMAGTHDHAYIRKSFDLFFARD